MANLKLDGVNHENIHNVTIPRADGSGDQWFIFGDVLQYVGTFDIEEATDTEGGNACPVVKGALTALKNAVDASKFNAVVQAVMIPADQQFTRESEWFAAFKGLSLPLTEDKANGASIGFAYNSYSKSVVANTGAYANSSTITVNYDPAADMLYLKNISGRLSATKMNVFYLDIPFMTQQSS